MEKQTSNLNNGRSKVKMLCSYGGRIQPRPTDHQLSYIGGDTKLLIVDRNINFSDVKSKLLCLCHRIEDSDVSIKYQLPGEDLDALVSLIDDEDVKHMMVEYDRMQRITVKPSRLRLFIFDISNRSIPMPAKSGFKNLNPGTNPDYLFGFDKEYQPSIGPPLDLMQIPGMDHPENYGSGFEGKTGLSESDRVNNVSVNGAAAGGGTWQAVYRIPAVANGGVYSQTGEFGYGVLTGVGGGPGDNRVQPVYSFIPLTPTVSGMKVNQRQF